MRQPFRLAVLLGLGIALPALAQAQSPRASSEAHPLDSATQLTLGQSAFPLNGPWKFQIGDSPIDPTTGQPLWAQPGFDDSRWENVDLTPDPAKLDANGQMPGWAALGHPGDSGYAWYRIRIRIDPPAGEKLALAGPNAFDDAYEVFLNGDRIGEFGFNGKQPKVYFAQPALFPLPQPSNPGAQSDAQSVQTQLIAFRFWASSATLVQQTDAGGFHDAPLLGSADALTVINQVSWMLQFKQQAATLLLGVIFTLLTVTAFVLFLYNPADRAYFWMAWPCLLGALVNWEYALAVLGHELFTAHTDLWFGNVFVLPISRFGWFMLLRAWFQLERPRWLPWAVALLALLRILSVAGTLGLIPFIPDALASICGVVSLVLSTFTLLAVSWVQYLGIRKSPVDGSFFLPMVVLAWMDLLGSVFPSLGISHTYTPFGFTVQVVQIEAFAIVSSLCALLIRRWIHSVQDQRQMALDVKQAQEVQQVILPEAQITHPGLTIESVYRPAREVGGDFFQIIPDPSDGSLLIVAGDVAGKGLQAGMLVALLIGAIRNQTESTFDPSLMLKSLNRRLLGRGDAAATCLALRIASDGSSTLANSGHLPPYRNGEPLPMEGALPLGMFEFSEPSIMHFQLQPNDRLVLISDGILEAADSSGQLFGFDRIQILLATPVSAAEVAGAAQAFGQNDDISVITLTCTAATIAALTS